MLVELTAAAAEIRDKLASDGERRAGFAVQEPMLPGHERGVRNAPMRQIERLVEGLSLIERSDLLALLWAARDFVEPPAESIRPWLARRTDAFRLADNLPYILGYAILPDLVTKAAELLRGARS